MSQRRRIAAFLGPILVAALAAAPARAQSPEPGLPRVYYGTPQPQVLYGAPTAPEPRRSPGPVPPPAAPPQTSLEFQSGPAYLPPPGYWARPPRWAVRPWPDRAPPQAPSPFVSPRGGAFEPPLPQGRYVGRPPGAAPPPPRYGRPEFR